MRRLLWLRSPRTGLAKRVVLTSLVTTWTGILLCAAVASAVTLPDNRVFEQVTPHEKGGSRSFAESLGFAYPSPSGDTVITSGGAASSVSPSDQSWVLRKRTPAGWATVGSELGPPLPAGFTSFFLIRRAPRLAAWSSDYSRVLFATGLPIDPRDRGVNADLYLHATSGGAFDWVSGPAAPGVKGEGESDGEAFDAFFGGASADLETVVWSQQEPLVAPPGTVPPGNTLDTHAAGANEVYESVKGVSQLVGILPDGSVPACGAALGNEERYAFAPVHGAVSPDGSQVLFASPDPDPGLGCAPPEIYMRVNGEQTVAVSATQKHNGSGPNGGDPNGPRAKWYVGSTNDGSKLTKVFFISSEELTNSANTGSADQGSDLYEYDVATHTLIDLTLDGNPADASGAGVVGFAGSSADGSHVYFVATGALAPGASSGQPNLYLYDAASAKTTFIAPAAGMLQVEEGGGPGTSLGVVFPGGGYGDELLTTRVTPDGLHLLFEDSQNLTSFQQNGHGEIYLYDVSAKRLTCVSCDPAGAPPTAAAVVPGMGFGSFPEQQAVPLARSISDGGSRVFFGSADQLTPDAPAPASGVAFGEKFYSVYEWESGRIYLISAAESTVGSSYLLTATPSGNDVFFTTARQLAASDTDGTFDVYDARVDGGFRQPSPPLCSGGGCQGVPGQPPIFATPASVTFNGVGNFEEPSGKPAVKKKAEPKVTKCKKGFVKKHGKCVRKPKPKAKAKKASHKGRAR
jgi:hypothetical protein